MNPFSNANEVLDNSSKSGEVIPNPGEVIPNPGEDEQMKLFQNTSEKTTPPESATFNPSSENPAAFAPAENPNMNPPTSPPAMGGQSGETPFGTPTPSGQGQFFSGSNQQVTPKYNIIDLFWLINQKLIDKKQMEQNEVHLLTLGYNASFGNLRMTFYTCNQNTFTPSSIILANAKRVTTVNMYPEACMELLSKKDTKQPITLFERTIRSDIKWSPNQTTIIWAPNAIRIQTTDPQNASSLFDITSWQVKAFEHSLKFMTTGKSWNMNMQSVFHK